MYTACKGYASYSSIPIPPSSVVLGQEAIMRRFVLIALALVIVLAALMVGCGGTAGIGTIVRAGDWKITLDRLCWIDEEGGPGWDGNQFWLVTKLAVKNEAADGRFLNYEDIYLITPLGKVYENSELVFGWEPYGRWQFETVEVDSIAHMWYFNTDKRGGRADLEELRNLDGVKLVVGRVEFELPRLASLDMMTAHQYYERYGETPPPSLRLRR
jgi:hypothetical protein